MEYGKNMGTNSRILDLVEIKILYFTTNNDFYSVVI